MTSWGSGLKNYLGTCHGGQSVLSLYIKRLAVYEDEAIMEHNRPLTQGQLETSGASYSEVQCSETVSALKPAARHPFSFSRGCAKLTMVPLGH